MLLYVKFAEDKILVFVVLREECEKSAIVSLTLIPNPNLQRRLIR